MLDFNIRKVGQYLEVTAVYNQGRIELGLLNEKEQAELAATLRVAANALAEGRDGR